jgi:CelD/BcsL family acetyltransferase involved in cellulose biosynthesis
MLQAQAANHTANPLQLRPHTVALRYSLSYLKLFELKFNALENAHPFDPERPAFDNALEEVTHVPDGYDAIVLRNELLRDPIPKICTSSTVLRYAPRQLTHYYTLLHGDSNGPMAGMSSKTRSTLSRKVRRYREFCGGEIQWAVYRTPDEMREFFAVCRELVSKTYQERLFDSGLPDTEEFRAYTLDLAKRDAVRSFALFHGNKPIAYLHTPAPDGVLIYEYLGYDPAYAEYSPGTVLQYLALEKLHAEQRFGSYYWGYGYSQTKHIFATGQALGADIFYFRRTPRNVVAVHLHQAVDRFSESMGRLLDRLKVRQHLKKLLKKQ